MHQSELTRRTHVQGQPLRKLMYNAASPSRVQWYLNHLRALHLLPVVDRALRGSGTSPNEAFHAELNGWLRNQPEVFSSTVELQLRVNMHAKLLAHVSALSHPTLRGEGQRMVLARSCSELAIPDREWSAACADLRISAGPVLAARQGPLRQRRVIDSRIIAAHGKTALAALRKRPAGNRAVGLNPIKILRRVRKKTSSLTLAGGPRVRLRGKLSLQDARERAQSAFPEPRVGRKRTAFTLARSAWRRRVRVLKRPSATAQGSAQLSLAEGGV